MKKTMPTTAKTYCGRADTAKPTLRELSEQLTESLRHPSRRTLTLINKALRYLTPFESPKAKVVSPYEKEELLMLLDMHRRPLSPYIDVERIEFNLRQIF